MKNLKVTDKIVDLLSNKIKLSKKVASLSLAATLATAPISGNVHADSAKNNIPTTISLVSQEAPTSMHMTMEEYENGVINAYTELLKHINYEHMMADVQSAYYLVNYEYIDEELEKQLISKNYITENDMMNANGQISMDNQRGWLNVSNFRSLKNTLNDYNQSTIHFDYINGTMSEEHLIDPSVLCADEHDREDAHELFMKWFNGYNLEANTIISNDSFTRAHKQLTQLNAAEQESELYDASVGARWLMLQTTGQDMMNFLRDYMLENYTYKDLDVYFKPDELRQAQFFLRDDFYPNLKCVNELEYIVDVFGQEWHFCLDEVNKDMFTVLTQDELKRDGIIPNQGSNQLSRKKA